MEAIYKRRSIRKYKSIKVSDELVKQLIKAGMNAPSAGNQQPWEFVVMNQQEDFDAMLEVHPYATPLKNAGLGIVVCADKKKCSLPNYWVQDCSAATQNILIEATSMG